MPVLHKYRSKEGHYVLAGVNGRIVTYRLSVDGVSRLQESSIIDGDKLSWARLLELIRQGDAYTSAGSTDDEDLSGWTQLGLLFNIEENEPTSAESVPLCACGSMEGLHISELVAMKVATLLCDTCRNTLRNTIDVSVPLYMITTPSALHHLLVRSGLTPDDSVKAFSELLSTNSPKKCQNMIAMPVKLVQAGLFQEPAKTAAKSAVSDRPL